MLLKFKAIKVCSFSFRFTMIERGKFYSVRVMTSTDLNKLEILLSKIEEIKAKKKSAVPSKL